jgi:hypothetical protein
MLITDMTSHSSKWRASSSNPEANQRHSQAVQAWTVVAGVGCLHMSRSDCEYAVYDQNQTYGRWPLTADGYLNAVQTYDQSYEEYQRSRAEKYQQSRAHDPERLAKPRRRMRRRQRKALRAQKTTSGVPEVMPQSEPAFSATSGSPVPSPSLHPSGVPLLSRRRNSRKSAPMHELRTKTAQKQLPDEDPAPSTSQKLAPPPELIVKPGTTAPPPPDGGAALA